MPKAPDSLPSLLLKWYDKNARRLPWRESQDPYRVWVSEIMLQQTQVETVIVYYEKWMRRFPDLRSLASASLENVLEIWAGLGYYRRARMLHEAARFIDRELGGKFPDSAAELLKLPGIGRYTAGAVASIAFGKKEPLVDGNVIRVLTRIFAITEDAGNTRTQAKIWEIAGELVPAKRPGDFNQALMELGATVCFPLNPQCPECPVYSLCAARQEGRPEKYPVKARREKMEKIQTFALVRRHKEKVLIARQPENGRWGGLWMFPHWSDKETMLREMSVSEDELLPVTVVRHGFTRYQVTLNVFEQTLRGKPASVSEPKGPEYGTPRHLWVSLTELKDYSFPAPHLRIVRELLRAHENAAS